MPEISNEEWKDIQNILNYLFDKSWWDIDEPDRVEKRINDLIEKINARDK
jgi:NDP-sugar pyrophosphorylase family protein